MTLLGCFTARGENAQKSFSGQCDGEASISCCSGVAEAAAAAMLLLTVQVTTNLLPCAELGPHQCKHGAVSKGIGDSEAVCRHQCSLMG